MVASINDKFRKTFNSSNPTPTFVTVARSMGATTLSCDNLTGWPTDTSVDFITYKIDDEDEVLTGSQTDWKGIVSGNTITELTRVAEAADSGNDVNDIVVMTPTATWANDLVDGLLVSHNPDGTLKNTGWVNVSNIGSYTSNIQARRVADVVHLRGYAQSPAAFGTGWEDVATLPTGLRPTSYWEGTGAKAHQVRIQTDGKIGISRGAGSAQTIIYLGTVSYLP